MNFTGIRLDSRVGTETRRQCVGKIASGDGLQLVIQLDRQVAGLDNGEGFSRDVDNIGIGHPGTERKFAFGAGDRRPVSGGNYSIVAHISASKPFGFAVAQPEAVSHATAGEPMIIVRVSSDGVWANSQKSAVKFLRDFSADRKVKGSQFIFDRSKVTGQIWVRTHSMHTLDDGAIFAHLEAACREKFG